MSSVANPWAAFNKCVAAAFRVCRDEDVARDIATEVCGNAVAVLVDGAPPTVAMLATLANWRALDYVRKGKVEIVRGYDIERAADSAPTPEQDLEAKQERAALMARLSEAEAFVIERTGEGFSDDEIAVKLGKTAVAIRQVRSRARRKLLNGE